MKLESKSDFAPGSSIGLDTRTEEVPPCALSPRPGASRRGAEPGLRLIVTDTVPGSAAAYAGLQQGDWIVDVGGVAARPIVLNTAINGKNPDAKINLHVFRMKKK